MINSYLNGNSIFFYNNVWCYYDGKKATKSRECPKCNKLPDKNGHDACLGQLHNVKNACCGHGVEKGYIQFKND